MVRNTKGGSSHKKQARKHTGGGGGNSRTRFSEDPAEIYACCSKLLGNGMCYVKCQDNIERLCVIRKKFKGRGKRGNEVSPGVWLLVGKREFEGVVEGRIQKVDLLEVYSQSDKKKLQQSVSGVKWTIFNGIGSSTANDPDDVDGFEFGDTNTINYEQMLEDLEETNEDEENEVITTIGISHDDENGQIDVDDI